MPTSATDILFDKVESDIHGLPWMIKSLRARRNPHALTTSFTLEINDPHLKGFSPGEIYIKDGVITNDKRGKFIGVLKWHHVDLNLTGLCDQTIEIEVEDLQLHANRNFVSDMVSALSRTTPLKPEPKEYDRWDFL